MLPLVGLTEIDFIVAAGVLPDTFVVRSILVPAPTLDVGSRTWWPSSLSREQEGAIAGVSVREAAKAARR